MTSVLIVDDHPAFRLVLRHRISQMLGVTQVFEAGNGQDSIALARQAQPRLVILDLDLPRLNGLDAMPRIRKAHAPARILVVSAQNPALFAPRAKAAGAHGYASKTLEFVDLIRAIETVLAGYSVFPDECVRPSAAPSQPDAELISRLSDREIAVTQMLAQGLSNKQIGAALFISNKTVSTYKARLMQKLGVGSLVELIDLARRNEISV